jgi:transposase
MNQLIYTAEEKKIFNHERFHHPHPRVQLKMEVLWFKSQGMSNSQIAIFASICENTVRKYLKEYAEGGIEKLKEIRFYQPQSELKNHSTTLEEYFKKNPPMSMKEAVFQIEELTGITRSETQVNKFLKSLGMKCLKVGHIPGKVDIEAQKEYQEKKLEPLLKEAKEGKRAVFFVDAAHFVMRAFLGYIWCFMRVFIKSPSGRQRFNVLAALNAITHEVITVTNDTYITASM